MQFKCSIVVAAATLSLGVVSAQAQVFVDPDVVAQTFFDPPTTVSVGTPLTGTFDLVANGYATGNGINYAEAWFALDPDPLGAGTSGQYYQIDLTPGPGNTFSGYLPSGQPPVGGDITLQFAGTIMANGWLNYTISTDTDFAVNWVRLDLWTGNNLPDTDSVPDGGATAGLLGLAMVGIIPFRKRLGI